jgi:hypothetical protein
LYTPEERSAGRPTKSLETAQREGKYESEGWHVRGDGSRFFASVVIDAIRGDDGEILGFAKITRDITNGAQRRRPCAKARAISACALTACGLCAQHVRPRWHRHVLDAGAEHIRRYTADEIEDRFGGNAA